MRFGNMDFSQDREKFDDEVSATLRTHKGDLKHSPDEKVEVVGPKKKSAATFCSAGTTS